jgi:hypothetical protein
MANIIKEQTVDEIISFEIPDEALEALASTGNAGIYTQFGLCTVSLCPGVKGQALLDGDRDGCGGRDENAGRPQ